MKNRMISKVYSAVELYERAFSYRDISKEVKFLLKTYGQFRKRKQPDSAIEIACGPAAHAIEMRRFISNVHALDNSPEMLSLASDRAKTANLPIHIHLEDMRFFELKQPIDLAFCMLDSLSHIHTKKDMVQHLRTIERITSIDGMYIIEFAKPHQSSKSWRITDNDSVLHVQWGNKNDSFDLENKLIKTNIKIELQTKNQKEIIQDVLTLREWTLEDIQNCLAEIPEWICRNIYGDFRDIDHLHKEAHRMILVLEKNN